jgi:hypothetical protein
MNSAIPLAGFLNTPTDLCDTPQGFCLWRSGESRPAIQPAAARRALQLALAGLWLLDAVCGLLRAE